MAKNPSSFSGIRFFNGHGEWVMADIEVTPDVPFIDLVGAAASFFGTAFGPVEFDEFPAVLGFKDHHKIVIFDLPSGEAAEAVKEWNYRITIDPVDEAPTRDVSTDLIDSLGQKMPVCQLMRSS